MIPVDITVSARSACVVILSECEEFRVRLHRMRFAIP